MLSVIPPTGVPFDWRFVFLKGPGNGDNFRKELSESLGGDVYLTDSGRAALYLLLKSAHLNAPEKDEVIVADYTCWSVPSAVVKAGLKVRPVDIETGCLGLSPEAIPDAVSEKTLAVVFTHLFGVPGRIDAVEKACRESGVLLVDDAAQGLGAALGGRPLGSFGDAGVLSFGRGKCVTTLHGGAAVIRDKTLRQAARRLFSSEFPGASSTEFADKFQLALYKGLFHRCVYWIPDRLPFLKLGETVYDPGFKVAKMAENRAGRGETMLRRIDEISLARKKRADEYMEALAGTDGIELPRCPPEAKPVFLRLPILLKNGIMKGYILGKGHRLGVSAMYPGTVSSIEGLRPHLADDLTDCPLAGRVSGALVTLPTHYGVSHADIRVITDVLRKGVAEY